MKYECTVLFYHRAHREAEQDHMQAVHTQTVEADTPELAAEQMWVHCQNVEHQWRPSFRSMMVGDLVAVRDEESGMTRLCKCMTAGFLAVPLFT